MSWCVRVVFDVGFFERISCEGGLREAGFKACALMIFMGGDDDFWR